MSLGYEVTKPVLDQKVAQAALVLRDAFERIETITKWLANHPKDGANEPLVITYEYTADEAYAMRLFFETFDAVRVANSSTFDVGRKMTGLE